MAEKGREKILIDLISQMSSLNLSCVQTSTWSYLKIIVRLWRKGRSLSCKDGCLLFSDIRELDIQLQQLWSWHNACPQPHISSGSFLLCLCRFFLSSMAVWLEEHTFDCKVMQILPSYFAGRSALLLWALLLCEDGCALSRPSAASSWHSHRYKQHNRKKTGL